MTTEPAYQPGVAIDDVQLILEKIPARLWDELRGKKIFITGGSGFVGCWLLEALIFANRQLTLKLSLSVLTRNPSAFVAKASHLALAEEVNLIQGDVKNLQVIQDSFDIIIHAATDVINPASDPLAAYAAIVEGAQQSLELARRSNATRYLLTSSGAVYGRQPESLLRIPETYSGAPQTHDTHAAYGQAKRICEWLAHNYAQQYSINVQVARCFALIGPYLPLDAQFAVGNFIRDGLRQQPIAVNGDGTALRSYLYAADMTIWLLTILLSGEAGEQYNLGSDQEISIRDLAAQVSHIIYGENRITLANQPAANSTRQAYVPDIQKAQQQLGLAQYTDLSTAIGKTISWQIRRSENTH